MLCNESGHPQTANAGGTHGKSTYEPPFPPPTHNWDAAAESKRGFFPELDERSALADAPWIKGPANGPARVSYEPAYDDADGDGAGGDDAPGGGGTDNGGGGPLHPGFHPMHELSIDDLYDWYASYSSFLVRGMRPIQRKAPKTRYAHSRNDDKNVGVSRHERYSSRRRTGNKRYCAGQAPGVLAGSKQRGRLQKPKRRSTGEAPFGGRPTHISCGGAIGRTNGELFGEEKEENCNADNVAESLVASDGDETTCAENTVHGFVFVLADACIQNVSVHVFACNHGKRPGIFSTAHVEEAVSLLSPLVASPIAPVDMVCLVTERKSCTGNTALLVPW